MLIHFWGVRGSCSVCLTPQQIQKKISAVVQRITAEDIKNSDTRERFIARLPKWLFGTVGGNTPCVQFVSDSGKTFILDAGTGMKVMSKESALPKDLHYNLFFSHFHWDHIQGLPFFEPVYNPSVKFDVYSTFPAVEQILERQMKDPYFPVPWKNISEKFTFHCVQTGVSFDVDGISVMCCKMSHPGNSYSFSFLENGKKFVYATDVELKQDEFSDIEEKRAVFENADVLVFDAQYTIDDASEKANWGHSAFCSVIDFALKWNVKQLYLFHHEPSYDDAKLHSILQSALWYVDFIKKEKLQVFLATEGLTVEL